MAQNTSTAVMARRKEPHDSLDYFPTPPWATRALLVSGINVTGATVWEPACGDGHMVRPLSERAGLVIASDIHDYGWGHLQHDFLMPFLPTVMAESPDWVITNPPFRLAEQFVRRGLQVAKCGIAVIVRTAFAESVQRYEQLFRDLPPNLVAQFVERVPMVKGRVDEDAASATAYCWMVWDDPTGERAGEDTKMIWIPPCRARLEKPGDYSEQPTPEQRVMFDEIWKEPFYKDAAE